MQKCPFCKKREIVRSATCGDPECQMESRRERSSAWVRNYRISKKLRNSEQALKV
jgi:hypothetical protein